jgi:hypothetical protein
MGHFWKKLIELYTEQKLTMGKDKLPALVGLAEKFVSFHPKQLLYLGGLWSEFILEDLL